MIRKLKNELKIATINLIGSILTTILMLYMCCSYTEIFSSFDMFIMVAITFSCLVVTNEYANKVQKIIKKINEW